MSLSNDGFVSFYYRFYGTFFLQQKRPHNSYSGFTHYRNYRADIIIKNIPEKAYEYMVNGRLAIEWIMDQYQVKTDKKSAITDDTNDYSTDEKYILNLLPNITNVSMQTVDLVNSLPKFEVEE
mgnify:CR=1 FL=1